MTTRTEFIPVTIGDEPLIAECTVTGRFRPAITQADPMACCPEESPEVEVVKLWTADHMRDLSGMLAFDALLGEVDDQCLTYLAAHQNDGPDPKVTALQAQIETQQAELAAVRAALEGD